MVPGEAALIRDAASRVLAGETLVSIVNDWNDRGVRTTMNGPWHINALSALLIQPRLTPGILDGETHDRLIALRRARQKPVVRESTPARRYLLTGFLRCWRCGSRLNATARFGVTAQPCYRCPSRGAGGCSGAIIRTELADRAAIDAVVKRVDDAEFAASVRCQEARLAEEEQALASLFTDALLGGAGEAGETGFYVDGRIDGQAWRALRATLERWLDSRPGGLASRRTLTRRKELGGQGAALAADWEGLSLEARRSVLEAVVDHFVVWPAPRPRNSFGSERLKAVWKTS